MTNNKPSLIPNSLRNASSNFPYVAESVDIYDKNSEKSQEQVNASVQETLADHQNQINALDSQNYLSYVAEDGDTLADILPATGEVNTIYRVGSWDYTLNDGTGGYDETKYSEYAWSGTQYKPMDVKDMQLGSAEDFEEPDAEKRAKVPTVGAVADVHGYYIENPEFVKVELDANKRIIRAIKEDGTEYLSVGANIANTAELKTFANKEYLSVVLDTYNKLLEAISRKGEKVINTDIKLSGEIKLPVLDVRYEDNPEWASVTIDRNRRIVEGIKRDGYKFIAKSNIWDEVESLIDSIEETLNKDKSNKITIIDTNISVRSRLSDENDIIITFRQDPEGFDMAFRYVYIGPKNLSDSEIMTTQYIVHNFSDSVGAIGIITFWFLYAQHGWAIPRVEMESVTVDTSDINSVWQDQNGNRFILANISGHYVYFMPEVTLDSNDIYRASYDPSVDPAISKFIHVSGATHTSDITGTIKTPQLQIQTAIERKFVADGKVITENGTYYCDEFTIFEHLLGHNPAFVSYYPDFSYGDSLIDWDRSFIIRGSSIACNTIINTKHKFELRDYRGVIPMMPYKHGAFTLDGYDVYSLIPKVKKTVNGHRVDLPFETNDGLEYVDAYRNTTDLYDKDNQPERCISYLKSTNNDKYLVGIAGGGSLVRGLSVPSVRNQYVPDGEVSMTYGGSSTPNKFYPFMLHNSGFENQIVPESFIIELSCYFCWFDPNKNDGQVYWYKDADSYILYIHCQTSQPKMEVHLPDFMEGMRVAQTIEKTDGATLLTEQVVSNRLYVKFDTTENVANYIVLKIK